MSSESFVVEINNEPKYQRLLAVPQTQGLKSGKVHIKPGDDCGIHSTEDREEILVFLQGKGKVFLGKEQGSTIHVGLGRVAYIPPNTVHNVKNTGSEPLIYIFTVVPIS